MPRPESPEGRWVTIPVRVRESLRAHIDGVRGERNRSEWMRESAEITLGLRKPNGDLRAPGATRESLAAAAKRPRAAAKSVTPGAAGVPAAAFQEPAELVPEPRRAKAACKHPGVGRKQRCRACGQFNA